MNERKMIYLDDAIDAICKHGTDLERRGILVLALVEHKQMTIDLLESMPSAQPEITETQVKEYCEKRCLVVLDSEFFHRLPSAQPEIVRCKDCKHYMQTSCPMTGTFLGAYFCSFGERRQCK